MLWKHVRTECLFFSGSVDLEMGLKKPQNLNNHPFLSLLLNLLRRFIMLVPNHGPVCINPLSKTDPNCWEQMGNL